MSVKIGINGLGRIGRMVIRSIFENKYKNLEIKHINNRSNSEISSSLLKYDSVHGKFKSKINFDKITFLLMEKKYNFSRNWNWQNKLEEK